MPYVHSMLDDELYNEVIRLSDLEERTVSNFVRVSIKERIIRIRNEIGYENGR